VPVPPATPDEAIDAVTQAVEDLVAEGALSHGESVALTSKLDAALRQIDRGNYAAAADILEAFINQVEAMLSSGRLTVEQAQALIDAANAALALIET
jgi:hypothetical protein